MKKIGVFSGSFNPIHIAHLMLANYLVEYTDLDELLFVVSPKNPLKSDIELLSDDIRLKMAQIAVDGLKNIKVSDIEFQLPKPSYTINLLDYLSKRYENCEFVLIIGSDNWSIFNKWKNSDEIYSRFKIMIYPRIGYDVDIYSLPSTNISYISDAPVCNISSTFIRKGLKLNKNLESFVPQKVYEFIKENNIY